MKSTKRLVQLSTAIILTLFLMLTGVAKAESTYDDTLSLHGITEAKTYFSIDTTLTPERLPMILYGIIVTHGSLVQQGVAPNFIVGIWGTNLSLLTEENADPMVKGLLQQLDALGVRLEICYAAMEIFGVSAEDVLPELDIVGSVWISQLAYTSKSKGYARIDF